MKFLYLFFFSSLLHFTVGISFAQNKEVENAACNPTFSRQIVEQQVAESKMVEATDKRVNILLRAADFLWKYDEPTARKFYKEAFDTADARFKQKGFVSKENSKTGLTHTEPDYRMTVVGAIAKKDSEWAKRLSEQVLKDFEADRENRKDHNKDSEIGSLLWIARENAETNPAFAQYLLRRVMRYPLDQHWFFSLFPLAEKNKPLADSIYLELLQNYQNEPPSRLLFLSAYPFASQRILGVDKMRYGSTVPAAFAPNPNLQARFFDTFLRRVANFAGNSEEINRPAAQYELPETVYIFSALQDIEPIIQRDFPALAARFSTARAQASSIVSEQAKKDLDGRRKAYEIFGATLEERLKKLEKDESENKLRDGDIVALLLSLKKEADFEIGEPWLEKIKDEKARRDSMNHFYFRRSQLAREEKRLDDARKYAQKVEELEHRAILFFELANEQLKNKEQAAQATDILGEVSELVRKADDSVEKAQVLLGLALASEKVSHQTALFELGDAVKLINRLENPDIFSSGITRMIKTKELTHYTMISSPGYNLENAFTEVSRSDFEIPLALAKSLNDNYFRTLAVIAVVKNCVEKNEKKPARPKNVK
jgi:hypothetical protein